VITVLTRSPAVHFAETTRNAVVLKIKLMPLNQKAAFLHSGRVRRREAKQKAFRNGVTAERGTRNLGEANLIAFKSSSLIW